MARIRHTNPAALLASLLATAVPAAAQTDGHAVLEAAARHYAGIETVCADFVQELDNPLLGEVRTSRGRLCQRRPNFFRMDFSDPEGDEIVADGEHFWLFYRSLNPDQVLRFPLDPTRGGLDFFREFLSDPGTRYEVEAEGTDVLDGISTVRLKLVPREPRDLVAARVWIDPGERLIRRIEVEDQSGLVRRVDLARVTLDPALDSEHFRFAVPSGVAVVDAG